MKKLSWFHKIVLVLNAVLAIILFTACLSAYIPAELFPYLAILGLGMPILVLSNFLFVPYWLLFRKKYWLLSAVPLLLGYLLLGPFVKLSFKQQQIAAEDLSIMSFNVRVFDRMGRYTDQDIFREILDFITGEDPDIICFQEMDDKKNKEFKNYPYYYVRERGEDERAVLGIYSKFPILDQGSLDWPNTGNNGIYVDIRYKNDTLRVYNVHLESYKFHPQRSTITKKVSRRLFARLTQTFKKQAEEAQLLIEHRNKVAHNTIICGDFNNTQFSNTYRLIRGDMNDSFVEKGSGFGRTYRSLGLPFRIDYLLVDPVFEVMAHKNYKVRYSDHFPVMASFRLKQN